MRWVVGGALIAALAVAGIGLVLTRRAEPFLRAWLVEGLSAQFHARVELDSLRVRLGAGLHGEWGLWARGRGLRIWPPAQVAGVGVPAEHAAEQPLIRVAEFRFHVPLRLKTGRPVQISRVELRGLEVRLPPHSHFLHAPGAGGARAELHLKDVRLGEVESTGALLVLETDKPGKVPTQIAIAHLKLTGITSDAAMHFEAELTNPRPVGTIDATGEFGPWRVNDPGESALKGDYRFTHADLSDFHGIAGMLSSTGSYAGTLRRLEVTGETDTPDFRLTHAGHAMDLKTQFRAQVDATNGDTRLEDVEATLGASHVSTRGQVVRVLAETTGPPRSMGHDILLNVRVTGARVEDFLRLAMSDPTPLLSGNVTTMATVHIPPGRAPVRQRMKLQGQYTLTGACFSSVKVQRQLLDLSARAQGRPGAQRTTDPRSILSQIRGHFQIADGVLSLPDLRFSVPGADVDLHGTYALDGGALDFSGVARTKATVSEMVGGWKGLLLKPADKLFERGGAGAVIPIHLTGTPSKPDFGIDLNRLKTTSPVNPATHPVNPASPQ
ncbi:MAG TPA: AsmA-like C-terminal region-containing protein [Terracidiphilus sp.]|nr:AsmA-like C-terminal region-containing protein [Terracidiphilus sp.]